MKIFYRAAKETLIIVNLVFAAMLMGTALYFGAAVVNAVSQLGDTPASTVENTTTENAPPAGCDEGDFSDPDSDCYMWGE